MAATGPPSLTEVPPMLKEVTVVIPALNEERSLPLVLRDLPTVGRVIVVDNGSTDATAAMASAHGAMVVHEPQRGYGAACLRGLAAIRELMDAGDAPPRVVVFLDADYSDHPELLPRLVEPILGGRADFVLGSRLAGQRDRGHASPKRVWKLPSLFLAAILFGVRYSDLGPFRAIDYQIPMLFVMSDRTSAGRSRCRSKPPDRSSDDRNRRALPKTHRPEQDQRHLIGHVEGRT